MTVEPGSPEWSNYTGNPDDYPAYHDYHYRPRTEDPVALRQQNVDPAPGGGGGGGYYSPEAMAAGNLPPQPSVYSSIPASVPDPEPVLLETQEQLKQEMLQSPTARWASADAYNTSYLDFGGGISKQTLINTPSGVVSTLPNVSIPSVGGMTTFITPSGDPIDAPTEHAEQMYAVGAVAAPYTPSRDRDPLVQSYNLQGLQSGLPDTQGDVSSGNLKNPFTGEMMHDTRPDPFSGLPLISGDEWLEKTREGKVLERINEPDRTGYQWVNAPETESLGFMASIFGSDSFTRAVDNQIASVGNFMSDLDHDVSKALNLQSGVIDPVSDYYKKASASLETMGIQSPDPKGKQILEDFGVGFGQGLVEKPLTTLGNVVIAFAVTKGVGSLLSKAPVLARGLGTGKLGSQINPINIAGVGIAGLYGADVYGRVSDSPAPAETFGEITSTELLPFAAGGYLGTKDVKLPSLSKKSIEPWKGTGFSFKEHYKAVPKFDDAKFDPILNRIVVKKPQGLFDNTKRYEGYSSAGGSSVKDRLSHDVDYTFKDYYTAKPNFGDDSSVGMVVKAKPSVFKGLSDPIIEVKSKTLKAFEIESRNFGSGSGTVQMLEQLPKLKQEAEITKTINLKLDKPKVEMAYKTDSRSIYNARSENKGLISTSVFKPQTSKKSRVSFVEGMEDYSSRVPEPSLDLHEPGKSLVSRGAGYYTAYNEKPDLVKSSVSDLSSSFKVGLNEISKSRVKLDTVTLPVSKVKLDTVLLPMSKLKSSLSEVVMPRISYSERVGYMPVLSTLSLNLKVKPKLEFVSKKDSFNFKKLGKPGRKIILNNRGAKGKLDPWYPASLENIVAEEMQTGKVGTTRQIASRKKTQGYLSRLAKTGVSIPTLAQSKKKLKGQSGFKFRNVKL